MSSRNGFALVFLLLIFSIIVNGQEGNSYRIAASFNADTEELKGSLELTLAPAMTEDLLFFSLSGTGESKIEISSATVDGAVVEAMVNGDQLAIEGKPGSKITLNFRIPQVIQNEGIYYFSGIKGASAWFPHLSESKSSRDQFTVDLSINGPGAAALPAGFSVSEANIKNGRYSFHGYSHTLPSFVYSPIFVEKRVSVGGCDLGLFMREGSEVWQGKALSYLAEVFSYYKEKIPEFGFTRLDGVMVAAQAPPQSSLQGVLLLEDQVENMLEEFGAVFAANFIRWDAAMSLSRFFWAGAVNQGESIPWLSRGISLYWAERYSNQALLGGPAFDNIRQFYINAASSGIDTTLDKTLAEAEKTGIDAENILAQSKGLWVTRLLAARLGSNGFKAFQRALLADKGKLFTNREIVALANDVSGKNLASFAKAWIWGNARLDFAVTGVDNGSSPVKVILENKGNVSESAELQVSYADGSQDIKRVNFEKKKEIIELPGDKKVARVRIDPEANLPDINRADNLLSKMGSARIKQLYSIDEELEIGDVTLQQQPQRGSQGRSAPFSITLANRQETTSYLGLHLSLRFPGGRNRGITRLLVELAPGEEKTISSEMKFPMKGLGLAYLTADFFKVSSEAAYKKLNRRSKPTLRSHYIFNITE